MPAVTDVAAQLKDTALAKLEAAVPAVEAAPQRIKPPAPPIREGKRARPSAQLSLLDQNRFEFPDIELLAEPRNQGAPQYTPDSLEQNAGLLEGVLEDFGIKGEIFNVRPGPVVTLYELEPAPGIKSSRVIGLADDIARSIDKGDVDPIQILALPAQERIVAGFAQIGFRLKGSDLVGCRYHPIFDHFDDATHRAEGQADGVGTGAVDNGDNPLAILLRFRQRVGPRVFNHR